MWRRSAARLSLLAVLWSVVPLLGASAVAQDPALPTADAVLLDVEGAIGPATAEYLSRGFAEASRRGSRAIILRMDTPGGLDSSMRDIIRAIIASPIPVITYVSPSGARAASAGTYILYASHVAAMAPGTNLGAATPVQLGGGRQPFGGADDRDDKEKEGDKTPRDASASKAVNDAAAYIRGLAELRGRNIDWAERAVREAASLPAREALAQGVVDIVATGLEDLLAQADGRTVRVLQEERKLATGGVAIIAIEPDWRARILATITNPTIAYVLLLVGIYGLLFEFMNPGAIAPGVIGTISLLIGLFALNLLPVSYAGAALLLLGIALMVAEALVPSFGILGFGGIAAFALGSLLMFDGSVPGFALSWPVVLATTAASAIFLVVALGATWRAHKRKVATGDTALLGSPGRVIAWTGHEGQVQATGERWRACSTVPLAPGQRVRIIGRRDLTLVVEPERETPQH